MKIELFDFVDDSLELLKSYNTTLDEIAKNIIKCLKEEYYYDDKFLNFTYRIKSEDSFREKIIKNNFFLSYETVEKMFLDISDLIGIRIECRFIKEEEYIYNKLKNSFSYNLGNGYFKIDELSPIRLKLQDEQPQIQKNGFEIYKIDGVYEYGKNKFNFELQIKSMVNVFWGEIDHKILYKNYNYMIGESFFKEMMASIKDSLSMVDRQLQILYDNVTNIDNDLDTSSKHQLKYLLSKLIHDIYSNKIRNEFGFVFNFKHITDLIVEYLFLKFNKEKESNFGENFIDIINVITTLDTDEIDLEEYIEIKEDEKTLDNFTKSIFKTLKDIVNKDFSVNLLIKILYNIESKDYKENICDFLNFLRYKYTLIFIEISENFNMNNLTSIELEKDILNVVIDNFSKNKSLKYLVKDAPDIINITYKKNLSRYALVSDRELKSKIINKLNEVK